MVIVWGSASATTGSGRLAAEASIVCSSGLTALVAALGPLDAGGAGAWSWPHPGGAQEPDTGDAAWTALASATFRLGAWPVPPDPNASATSASTVRLRVRLVRDICVMLFQYPRDSLGVNPPDLSSRKSI